MKNKTKSIARVDDLTIDPDNRRQRDARARDMIVESLKAVGGARSIVIDERGVVLAGNGVIDAATEAGIVKVRVIESKGDEIIAVRRSNLSKDLKRALAMYDNRTGELATWNAEQLAADLRNGEDLGAFFTADELAGILGTAAAAAAGQTDPDEVPAERRTGIVIGDLFELGAHRLICGDTTDPAIAARLVDGLEVTMFHADPPYGMGKEADGIANDNLRREKLDAFQMLWWRAWLPTLSANGSAYVWGNAPDLWRLWYRGGLNTDPDLMVRNEIVWDKGSGFGMSSEGGHSFPPATERCLFLMRGQQFLGNQNKDDYWEGYEPLRAWLIAQRDLAGWTNADVNKITRSFMSGHWFSQSQFHPIPERQYLVLQAAAEGRAFTEKYSELFGRLFGNTRSGGNAHRRELSERLRETRTYFDNAHDTMTDVWTFPRVHGEERFGHATPKPVAMVSRAVMSSCPADGVVGVPFVGTGPEFIAAEQLGRRSFGAEIEPRYCQVVIDRWEAFTGKKAKKAGDVAPRSRKRRG